MNISSSYLGVYLLILALIMLISYHTYLVIKFVYLRKRGIRCKAKLITKYPKGLLAVEFLDANNNKQRALIIHTNIWGKELLHIKEGDEIEIFYNPRKPNDAIHADNNLFRNKKLALAMFAIPTIAFSAAALFAIYLL